MDIATQLKLRCSGLAEPYILDIIGAISYKFKPVPSFAKEKSCCGTNSNVFVSLQLQLKP